MALYDIWRTNPSQILTFAARQIVSIAGDGKLRDASLGSDEFRKYLSEAPSERLFAYVGECLEEPFTDSGLVLQDVVNEVGRRLEFEVEHGLYRGRRNVSGHDGVWRSATIPEIIVEVKTTDQYTIPLETLAEYKRRLRDTGKVSTDASLLIVAGREDTGALEAQIRGSRYAWDIRLISIESLAKLLRIKEKSNSDQTVRQIRELLRPFEYTRVDKIIDVIFNTAADVEQQVDEEAPVDVPSIEGTSPRSTDRTASSELDSKRADVAAALGAKFGSPLVRRRRALFDSANSAVRAAITISKRYDRGSPYWYAYHPAWDDFLSRASQGYFVLGCMDRETAYALPLEFIREHVDSLSQSVRPDGTMYWHINLSIDRQNRVRLNLTGGNSIGIEEFAVGTAGA